MAQHVLDALIYEDYVYGDRYHEIYDVAASGWLSRTDDESDDSMEVDSVGNDDDESTASGF